MFRVVAMYLLPEGEVKFEEGEPKSLDEALKEQADLQLQEEAQRVMVEEVTL